MKMTKETRCDKKRQEE